jgi:hypothetical protein
MIRTMQFRYAIEHLRRNGFDQDRPLFRLKTDFIPVNRGTYRCGYNVDWGIYGFVRLSKALHFRDRMQNGAVMATVVEPANPSRAPAAHMFCQIHGDLPAEGSAKILVIDHVEKPSAN